MRSAEAGRSTGAGLAISVAAVGLGAGLAVLAEFAQQGRLHAWIAVAVCVVAGIVGGRRQRRGAFRNTFFLVLAAETGYLAVAFARAVFGVDGPVKLQLPGWESWALAAAFVIVGACWLGLASGAMAFLIRRPVRG